MCKRYGVDDNAIQSLKSIEIDENSRHYDHWCRDLNHDYRFDYFSFNGEVIDVQTLWSQWKCNPFVKIHWNQWKWSASRSWPYVMSWPESRLLFQLFQFYRWWSWWQCNPFVEIDWNRWRWSASRIITLRINRLFIILVLK